MWRTIDFDSEHRRGHESANGFLGTNLKEDQNFKEHPISLTDVRFRMSEDKSVKDDSEAESSVPDADEPETVPVSSVPKTIPDSSVVETVPQSSVPETVPESSVTETVLKGGASEHNSLPPDTSTDIDESLQQSSDNTAVGESSTAADAPVADDEEPTKESSDETTVDGRSAPPTSPVERVNKPIRVLFDEEDKVPLPPKEEGDQEMYTIDDAVDKAGYGMFQKYLTFLAGLGWFADSFEIIILSLIGDMMACEWPMRRWQNAVMTSIVFIGMTIGAPLFGVLADKFGRKMALALSMLLIFVFGASSATSPNYGALLALRGLMGFALGGIAQGVTLCCEYYPAKNRGRAGFYLSYYWALGATGVVGAAWLIMAYTDNWRIFVFVAATPALLVLMTMWWYPESARYYLVSNRSEEAVATLERMARMNKSELPKGKLVEMDATEQRGKITDLLGPNLRRTTLLFWYIWLAVSFAYYGIALITPYIIANQSLLEASKQHQNMTVHDDFMASMPCIKYTNENFRDLLWTTAAEFPGLLIFTFAVECCSRRVFLGSSCILLGFIMLLLMLKTEPEISIFIILFVCRGLVAAVFQLIFIMTTEAFPTTLRASAMGTSSGCARIGGLLIPFLAQIAVIAKPIPSIFILSASTVLAGTAAFLLPVDTRGQHMSDSITFIRNKT